MVSIDKVEQDLLPNEEPLFTYCFSPNLFSPTGRTNTYFLRVGERVCALVVCNDGARLYVIACLQGSVQVEHTVVGDLAVWSQDQTTYISRVLVDAAARAMYVLESELNLHNYDTVYVVALELPQLDLMCTLREPTLTSILTLGRRDCVDIVMSQVRFLEQSLKRSRDELYAYFPELWQITRKVFTHVRRRILDILRLECGLDYILVRLRDGLILASTYFVEPHVIPARMMIKRPDTDTMMRGRFTDRKGEKSD